MKKLILPFLALLFLISCGKESTTELLPEQEVHQNGTATTRSGHEIALIQSLIDQVTALAQEGTLTNGEANSILAKLKSVKKKLEDGKTSVALSKLVELLIHIESLDLDPTIFEALTTAIEAATCELDPDCSTSCVEGELEVVLPDGSTLYVYPVDNSSGIPWSNFSSTTGATDLGNGDANTDAIVDNQGTGTTTYAAGLCASLKTDGCDWYLPAKNELNAMYKQLGPNGIGSNEMPNGLYWSSTELNDGTAWFQYFFNGDQDDVGKVIFSLRCRCVRR